MNWLAKQLEENSVEVASWPEWMRQDFADPSLKGYSDEVLLKAIRRLENRIENIETELEYRKNEKAITSNNGPKTDKSISS